jgi:single-strand DNA-binding protein
MRVIVTGRLAQRSYDTENGKRTVYEITADDVGVSLRTATAKITRASRARATDDGQATAGYDTEPPF